MANIVTVFLDFATMFRSNITEESTNKVRKSSGIINFLIISINIDDSINNLSFPTKYLIKNLLPISISNAIQPYLISIIN